MSDVTKNQIRVTGAQWHRVVAQLIQKFDLGHVVFTREDVTRFVEAAKAGQMNVIMDEDESGIHVYLATDEEVKKLAAEREAAKREAEN